MKDFIIIAILCVSAVLFFYAWITKFRMNQLLKHMDWMLDSALQGTFSESRYDETKLSKVESKLKQVLSHFSVSRETIEEDRARVNSLISDISHQIRTPVANILLYAQLLQETEGLGEKETPLVRQIGGQTEKLSFLIEMLVKVSRLENGIVQVQPERNDLVHLVSEVVAQCRTSADKKRINLVYPDGTKNVSAVFDFKWTVEALYNIVDNAVKYSPEGGKVKIEIHSFQLYCRIDVIDEGPGIAEADQTKVFQRFWRSPDFRTVEGVGIGLYLARKIVSSEEGYMRIKSAPGQGSCFSIYLPKG